MPTAVEVRNFSLKKDNFQLSNISFEVYSNEIFAVLGKTGAGKTLLLESIAGFYSGCEGAIYLNGQSVLDIPLSSRKIGFVYQDYSLFPHMTVEQNISYGLKMQRKTRLEIQHQIEYITSTLSISHILKQYPGTLSGGEKQRTALARALVLRPDILLLDEPFSALDPVTKQIMYKELLSIRDQFDCIIVFVTHDFTEAQMLAHRIGIMSAGCLKAIRSSDSLFDIYQDDDVNQFFGLMKGV